MNKPLTLNKAAENKYINSKRRNQLLVTKKNINKLQTNQQVIYLKKKITTLKSFKTRLNFTKKHRQKSNFRLTKRKPL